jgi:hypothetical protein
MWKTVRDERGSDAELKIALLQSLPGHAGYDGGSARRRLQAIANRDNGDNSALARIRLGELASANDCRADLQQLQQRLDKIVDIERSLDGNGHAPAPNPAR